MTDLKPAVIEALARLEAHVTASFPRADVPLPVIVVAEESGRVTAQADGLPYLEETALGVDVYAKSPEQKEALTGQVDAALTNLGLRRTLSQDLYDETAYAWRKRLRYRALLQGETIYQ